MPELWRHLPHLAAEQRPHGDLPALRSFLAPQPVPPSPRCTTATPSYHAAISPGYRRAPPPDTSGSGEPGHPQQRHRTGSEPRHHALHSSDHSPRMGASTSAHSSGPGADGNCQLRSASRRALVPRSANFLWAAHSANRSPGRSSTTPGATSGVALPCGSLAGSDTSITRPCAWRVAGCTRRTPRVCYSAFFGSSLPHPNHPSARAWSCDHNPGFPPTATASPSVCDRAADACLQ